MSSEQIERMAARSGSFSSGKAPKYVLPLIRFDGTRGEFRKIALDEDQKTETPLKKPVRFVILRKRRLLSSYSPKLSHFTNEHNGLSDTIQLFENVGGSVSHVMSGLTSDIRAKYPMVKTHEVLYVLLPSQEVCRIEVKGGSLGNFYDYLKALGAENLHTFQVVTSLSSETAENEAKFAYHRITFKNEPLKMDLNDVERYQEEVNENIQKIDDYFAKRQQQNKRNVVEDVTIEYPEADSALDIPF